MQLLISEDGRMRISYHTQGEPNGYLREAGLAFRLADKVDFLTWKRKGLWTSYPANAMAGNEGETSLFRSSQASYGEKPVQDWADDTHIYYYWADAGANCQRPLTQRAKSMKEHIFNYTLSVQGCPGSLAVYSPAASVACRMNTCDDGKVMLYVNNLWDYPEIAWGNYCKTLEASPCFGTVEMLFK